MRKIFHISDIHIRLYQRHSEYQRVFEEFYKILDDEGRQGDIIVIAGDLVHSKNEMSPELLKITSNFLKNCADRFPTILILGNHDLNLQNTSRMDALTPIVDLLDHPNLHFWKETGIYHLDGIDFSVMSVLDPPSKWINASKINSKLKIAIHHGAVDGSTTDLFHIIQNDTVKIDLFDGYDIVLLGDIHKYQYLDSKKRIAYSSSPIQQNQGETLHYHGILIWNLEDLSSRFIPLKNDYGYFTYEIIDGEWINETQLPKHLRARVKYKNTSLERVSEIIKGNTVQYLDIIYDNLDEVRRSSTDAIEDNFHDVEYQNSLICEYLKGTYGLEDEMLDSIRHINREINSHLKIKARSKLIWNLKTFEFSNMFSYGEDNFIDFGKMEGVYGLFAPNASGKTSLLSSLAFCLFDKCPVGSKGIYILNNLKDEFRCKASFSIGSEIYSIERIGTRNSKSVRVDVNFQKISENGEIENLNGEDRDGTNKNIREIIGTYEDFVMITLSTQLDNQSFIEKTQKERKELLYRFLNLSIFDELWKKGKEYLKEYQIHLSGLDIVQMNLMANDFRNSVTDFSLRLEEFRYDENQFSEEIKNIEHTIRKKYSELNSSIEDIDIDDIIAKKSNIIGEISVESSHIEEINSRIEELRESISNNISHKEEQDQLKSRISKLVEISKERNRISLTIQKLDYEISTCKEKIKHLEKHEYDPKCQYCIKNPFVIDARTAQEKLSELLSRREELQSEINRQENTSELSVLESKLSLLLEIEKNEDRNNNLLNLELERRKNKEQRLIYLRETLSQLDILQKKYADQEVLILKNKIIQSEISRMESEKNNLESNLLRLKRNDIERLIVEIAKCEEKIEKIQIDIERYKKYKSISDIYEMYVRATSKEGVPYKVLGNIIPTLESNVNRYLNSFCDFNVKFEMIDDKNINANVVYSEKKFWPIELSSGMERFIIGQVIRMGLLFVSNLPRPDFIAIDEGFGVLDSENLNSIGTLFFHMKDNSKLILCISHIDMLKDTVDNSFYVENQDGFSRIRYEGE